MKKILWLLLLIPQMGLSEGDQTTRTCELDGYTCNLENIPDGSITITLFPGIKKIDDCEEPDNCGEGNSNNNFMKQFVRILNPPNQCDCLSRKINERYAGLEKDKFENDKNFIKSALEVSVLESLGKKFLNDYASNLEDVSFFSANISTFFGKENHQNQKAIDYQCSNARDYEKAIDQKCGDEIPLEKRNERLDKFFGSYSGFDSPGTPLSVKLQELNSKISILEDSSFGETGGPYTRFNHDTTRFSLTKTDPEFKYIDFVIRKLWLGGQIQMTNSDVPYIVLAEKLMTIAKENPEYLDMNSLGEPLHSEYVNSIKNNEDIFSKAISKSMGLHPGFEAMMSSPKIFNNTLKEAKNKSIQDVLNSGKILGKQYEDNCKKLINHLTEAVCLKTDDIPKKLSSEDASKLVNDDSGLLRLIMCENKSPKKSEDFLSNLSMKDVKISDFTDRMIYEPGKQKNSFRMSYQKIKTKAVAFNKIIDSSLEATRGKHSRLIDSSLASNKYGSAIQGSTTPNASAVVVRNKKTKTKYKTKQRISESDEEEVNTSMVGSGHSSVSQTSMQNIDMGNYRSSTINPQQKDNYSNNDVRKEMRDFLSNEMNKENVEKLMANVDDPMMKELQKLKDEIEKNREKLAKLSSENEEFKLKEAQNQLKELEQKRSEIIAKATRTKASNDEYEQEHSLKTASSKKTGRELASVSESLRGNSPSFKHSSAGQSASSLTSSKTSVSAGSKTGQSSGISAGALNAKYAHSGPLIITSNSGHSLGKELSANEINLQIISYIEKNVPDIQALMNIRNTGMIYKYKMIENGALIEKEILVNYSNMNEEVKKLIDQKIAATGVLGEEGVRLNNDISKLKREYSYIALKNILVQQMKKGP